MAEKLAYRPGEAAELIGVSRTTLYGLMKDGEVGYIAVGRSRRIPRIELERWIASRTAEPRPAA